MNRAIIIIMMDFLISSFLLFMNVNEENAPNGYQVNVKQTISSASPDIVKETISITDKDIDEHYDEVFREEYYADLENGIRQKASDSQARESVLLNKLEAASRDISELRSANVLLQENAAEKELQNKNLLSEKIAIEQLNSDLKSDNERMSLENDTVRENLATANEKIKEQSHQLDLMELKNSNLADEVAIGKSKNIENEASIRKLQNEKEQLLADHKNERDSLNTQNEHLRKQNDEHLSKLNHLTEQVAENQEKLQQQADEFTRKYEAESRQQMEMLRNILSSSDDIRNRVAQVEASNEKLLANIEDNFREQFFKIQGTMARAAQELKKAQSELQDAVIAQNKEVIDKAQKNLEEALSTYNREKSAMSMLDMQNAKSSNDEIKRSVADARIALTFDLEDDGTRWLFRKDRQRFDTNGVIVSLDGGQTVALAHAKPFGMFWPQFDDGLVKAELFGRTMENDTPRSSRYTSFSTLSGEPSIISIPQRGGEKSLKLYTSTKKHVDLDQHKLKYYSQNSPSSQQNMDNWTIEPLRDSLNLPDRKSQKADTGSKDFEGDFIVDSDGYLICMMVSASKCVYIFNDDLTRATGYSFNIGNLSEFAKAADDYSKEMRN